MKVISKDSRLSQPTHKVKVAVNVEVPMRDETKLATDVYRPDVEGRFPAVLVRLPYGKTEAYCEMPAYGRYFAKRGYVFVVQDVRGKYDSEGDPYPFTNEPDDGYMTQKWIATQPWFNGNLGTFGYSYYGYTQWASAPLRNPNLKTMITITTAADLYGEWVYINGAFFLNAVLGWLYACWGSKAMLFHDVEPDLIPINLKHLPLNTADEAAGQAVPCYKDIVKHPNRDSYWKGKSNDYPFDQVAVPVLHIAGWYDIFLRGQLKDYVAMTKKAATPEARRNQKLVIAACHHGILAFGSPEERGFGSGKNIDFGSNADPDINTLCLRWFDYWLKKKDNGIMDEPPVRIFTMGENVWRNENEWPLARTQYTKYYFHSNGRANSMHGDGTLNTKAPETSEPPDTYVYDPNDPVPFAAEDPWYFIDTVKDQRIIEERDDVLVYTMPPLKEAVKVTGPLSVKLYASSTAKDTDFTAKLVDVHPHGYAQYIQEGIIRARYRESREKPSLIEPGKTYEYTIDLWATSNLFKTGHKIRVEISSSNFPRFDRNPNTGHEFGMDAETIPATQKIYHDRKHPSHILLPIIPR
ncbi:MAG: CocE/NonD family hydrolase [Candidatus Heimdallarchaeota archaeon]